MGSDLPSTVVSRVHDLRAERRDWGAGVVAICVDPGRLTVLCPSLPEKSPGGH